MGLDFSLEMKFLRDLKFTKLVLISEKQCPMTLSSQMTLFCVQGKMLYVLNRKRIGIKWTFCFCGVFLKG